MANESPQVKLPGTIYRERTRWWWKVQLPGEKSARSRALKPQGARMATTERSQAEEIALSMWQNALQAQMQAQANEDLAARMQRLRTRFREKTRMLKDALAKAEARAEAEATARAKLETELRQLREQMVQTAPCECCGSPVRECDLQRIDSGQRLCSTCLSELHQTAQRQSFAEDGRQEIDSWLTCSVQ